MTEHTDHGGHAPRPDDEELAAYLDGELDAVAQRRLEQRLADDPELTARLDALADALIILRGVDEVAPPTDYRHRLDSRLDREWSTAESSAPPHLVRRPRRRWQGALAVAAAIVLVAVAVPVALINVVPLGGADDTADVEGLALDAEEDAPDAAPEEAPEVEAETDDRAPDDGPAEADEDDAVTLEVPEGEATNQTLPHLLVDADGGAFDDPAALWPRYDGEPELSAPVRTVGQAMLESRAEEAEEALGELGASACAPVVAELFASDHAVVRLERVHVGGELHLAVVAALGSRS